MKKLGRILIVSALLLSAVLPLALPAAAEVEMRLSTATAFLTGMKEERYNSYVLTLELPPEGEEDNGFYAEIYTEVNCPFYDTQNAMLSPGDFFSKYQGQKVSVDFVELAPATYMIVECRAGER